MVKRFKNKSCRQIKFQLYKIGFQNKAIYPQEES